jgi:hypothetical protein
LGETEIKKPMYKTPNTNLTWSTLSDWWQCVQILEKRFNRPSSRIRNQAAAHLSALLTTNLIEQEQDLEQLKELLEFFKDKKAQNRGFHLPAKGRTRDEHPFMQLINRLHNQQQRLEQLASTSVGVEGETFSQVEATSKPENDSSQVELDPDNEQTQQTAPSSDSTQASVEEEAEQVQTNAVDPYDYRANTIFISLQLLPSQEDAQNRPVLIGVGLYNDPPLPPVIQQMLQQLESELPTRKAAYVARVEEEKRQEQEQKATLQSRANSSLQQSSKNKKTERPNSVPTPPSTLTEAQTVTSTGGKSQLSLF